MNALSIIWYCCVLFGFDIVYLFTYTKEEYLKRIYFKIDFDL